MAIICIMRCWKKVLTKRHINRETDQRVEIQRLCHVSLCLQLPVLNVMNDLNLKQLCIRLEHAQITSNQSSQQLKLNESVTPTDLTTFFILFPFPYVDTLPISQIHHKNYIIIDDLSGCLISTKPAMKLCLKSTVFWNVRPCSVVEVGTFQKNVLSPLSWSDISEERAVSHHHEATGTSQTSGRIYQTKRCQNPEDVSVGTIVITSKVTEQSCLRTVTPRDGTACRYIRLSRLM
jgi:hypothetical protein